MLLVIGYYERIHINNKNDLWSVERKNTSYKLIFPYFHVDEMIVVQVMIFVIIIMENIQKIHDKFMVYILKDYNNVLHDYSHKYHFSSCKRNWSIYGFLHLAKIN